MAKSMIQIRDDERMWIAMSDSFVSTVQDRNDPNTLVVRGRKAEHLKRLFPDREIVITPMPITWLGSWFHATSS
jgi:hypothetical protein